MITYDAMRAGAPRLDHNYVTHDGFTVDSAGAFLVHELERLDPTLHMPLASVTWGRDVDLREDVTIADDAASYTNSTFAAPGGLTPAGINWGGKNTTTIAGIAVDIRKTSQPLLCMLAIPQLILSGCLIARRLLLLPQPIPEAVVSQLGLQKPRRRSWQMLILCFRILGRHRVMR
jgi:hypothetical protein